MSKNSNFMPKEIVGNVAHYFNVNKPKMYVIGGMAGTVLSLFLTWRAAKKSDAVFEEVKNDIENVKAKKPEEIVIEETNEVVISPVPNGYSSKKEYQSNLSKACIKGAVKVGKLVLPPVATAVGSLALIGKGVGILSDRLVNSIEAGNAWYAMFGRLYNNVKKKYGEEAAKQLAYGIEEEYVEEPVVDENGEPVVDKHGEVKTKKVKQAVLKQALSEHSEYARVFDPEYCPEFEVISSNGKEDYYYNNKLINDWVSYFTRKIEYDPEHIVYLNQVYKEFGYSQTGKGQVVGWHAHKDYKTGKMVYDGDPDGIRIEIYPVWYDEENSRGELIRKKAYIMDFNVQGLILDCFKESKEDKLRRE